MSDTEALKGIVMDGNVWELAKAERSGRRGCRFYPMKLMRRNSIFSGHSLFY